MLMRPNHCASARTNDSAEVNEILFIRPSQEWPHHVFVCVRVVVCASVYVCPATPTFRPSRNGVWPSWTPVIQASKHSHTHSHDLTHTDRHLSSFIITDAFPISRYFMLPGPCRRTATRPHRAPRVWCARRSRHAFCRATREHVRISAQIKSRHHHPFDGGPSRTGFVSWAMCVHVRGKNGLN